MARERRQKALEDARDEREAQKEQNYMDHADGRNNGQYMFAPSDSLQQQTAPPDISELQIPFDDFVPMDQNDELFHFSDNMEELMTQLDELEEEQQNEPLPQVMAALPKTKRPTRKTTRKGAKKRKVHVGETSNDRWQQFPETRPNPLHSAVATGQQIPIPLSAPTVRRSVLKSIVRRDDKTAEDMEEEKEEALDLSRMPRSFPIGQPGEPTPGTTNLNEPPPGTMEPPNRGSVDKNVINPQRDDYPPGFSPLHRIAALETLLVTVTNQLSDLKSSVFANTRTAEEASAAPLKGDVADLLTAAFAQYNLAQADCGRVWSLATLNTVSG